MADWVPSDLPGSLLLHVATVILASNDLELDSGQVLGAATFNQHHMMLLQRVAFARDEAYNLPARAEPHTAALAVGRVGLLGLSDEGAQNDPFELRPAFRGPQM